jgi:tetratricopeptide (TPR) repeat protein
MSSASNSSKAQTFFKYGSDAAMKGNFDYAIDMYRQACKLEPENLVFRQSLRGAERRKFNNDPSKVGRMVVAKNQAIRARVKISKSKSNWAAGLETCEEAFLNNPWDVGVSRDAAECAEQLGYLLVAQWLIESVYGQATDADFFRYAAHIHKANADWRKAIEAWERVKKLEPNDEIAKREINALAASATIQRAGLNEAIDERQAAPTQLETEMEDMKASKLSPEERLLKEIHEDPNKFSPYLQLAEIYKHRGQLKEAEDLLARGLKAIPGNDVLKQAYAEVQISRIQGAIDLHQRKLKEKPNDVNLKAKLEEFEKLLNDYEIREFKRRLKLEPESAKLQLELGIRLARGGDHDAAIPIFQKAVNEPTVKVQALHQMGLSFESKQSLKLAERFYQDALKSADPNDKPTVIALHYRLGRVAEAQGHTQIAEEHYNEVAVLDYGYLDVAHRLKNLGS